MSANILLRNDLSTSLKRRYSETSTNILDLNYDCLREVCQHLDLASQFALLKSSTKFVQIILYDIWYQYYDSEFDITHDQSLNLRSEEFQIDFLKLASKQFSKIRGIPAKLFKIYIENSSLKNNREQISALHIRNSEIKHADDTNKLDMSEFLNFSKLQELYLENVLIKFDPLVNLHSLKTVSLTNYNIQGDIQGNFLLNIFSENLEVLILKPFGKYFVALYYDNFSQISKCINLKELTICSYHLNDPRFFDIILSLPNLTSLTIQSYDGYYFELKDHMIFYEIIKILYEIPHKTLQAIEMYGIPDKYFFQCPLLDDIPNISWLVTKIFHLHLDGCVDWKSDICKIIDSFYNFVKNSKYLQNLFLGNNIFHKKRVMKELNFVEKIQQQRCEKGFDKVKFVQNITDFKTFEDFNKTSEGSVRFFIKNKNV